MQYLKYNSAPTLYNIYSTSIKKTTNGLNVATFTSDTEFNINDDVAVVDANSNIVLDGIITLKKLDSSQVLFEYEMAEQAYELSYTFVKNGSSPLVKLSNQTIDAILDNYILSGTGWTRGSSSTTVVPYISFYYANRLDAIYKLIQNNTTFDIWFDDVAKKVFFANARQSHAEPTTYLSKIVEEDVAKHDVDYVIVLGKTDSVSAQYPASPSGTKVAVFRYIDATTNAEALTIAQKLFTDLGIPKLRISYEFAPTTTYNEGDTVTVGGVSYKVKDVTLTLKSTKIGLNSTVVTIQSILGDKLKEVTGEISSGATATYDGGLQNIGAPAVNEIITANATSNKIFVDNDPVLYSNGDRIVFSTTGTLPSPLSTTTTYYVVGSVTDGFQVATTSGGAAIDLTTNGSGIMRCRNLNSQSVPATYYINVANKDTIDNFNLVMDYDYYKEGVSIGDEVEFLSNVSAVSNSTAAGGEIGNGYTNPWSFILDCSKIETGFQFALVTVSVNMSRVVSGYYGYAPSITCYVDYGDGNGFVNTGQTYQCAYYIAQDEVNSPLCASHSFLVSGSPLRETSDGFVRFKFVVSGSITGAYGINCWITAQVNRIPRHTHSINKSYNVAGSMYPKNVRLLLTNSTHTDTQIATWSGTVADRKELDLTPYLESGSNRLRFFSESPGSVYLSGNYVSYS